MREARREGLDPDEFKRDFIGGFAYELGWNLDSEVDSSDLNSISEGFYESLLIRNRMDERGIVRASIVSLYDDLRERFTSYEIDDPAYGMSREDIERNIKGAIRTAFRDRADVEEY